MKFEHARNDANSSALNMDKLPEEGTDKLHAMDRLRDIAKKLNANTMSVNNGGKPLLDSNAQSHLKDLLDDALAKGDLTKEEAVGIAREALEKGEDYLNEDHKASIAADNEIKRAHHEDFLGHAEDMSEEALQRRGHDIDHSKAHEQHDYSINDDGTVGKRTGSSYHYREEDGSVGHKDGSGIAESVDHAVEGKDGDPMQADHPPKLLGLDKNGTLEQKEHFELMKKASKDELREGDFEKYKALEAKNPDLATPKYKGQVLGALRHMLSGEDGTQIKNNMGINEEDHDAADEASCEPPVGEPHPGADKGWNPASHRWNDKERLKELQGKLGPGEASYHPEGLHAGTDNAHLDQDKDGNVQGYLVTPTGAHPVNPPKGGEKGLMSADGGPVSAADTFGHHLVGHPGGGEKVDKKTLDIMGVNHSKTHTGKGQRSFLGQAFRETPGMKGVEMMKPVLGKLGRMLQINKESEEGKPNATATDRQRARRDTPGSPLRDLLGKIGTYTKEGLKDVAEELPGYLGGGLARNTDRYQDKQVRKAVNKVREQESAAAKLTARVNRVLGETDRKR